MAPGRAKRPREQEADATSDGAGTSTSALTALHRSRLVPWSVAPVTAIAACPDGSAIAAGYEDGKVEVWDVHHYNRLACIPGEDGAELSSLAWAQDSLSKQWRLFAARLSGQMHELSCSSLQAQSGTDAYGGAVWSLATEPLSAVQPGYPQHIAAACDDGSIRLFAVEGGEPGLHYVRTLAQAEGRALSVAWHPNGRVLVSGSSDGCIHCWEVATGHEVLRITAGSQTNAPPCVWSVLVLPDGTIVSGDSDGATQFWEGRFGTLLMRFQQHTADVLAVAAAPDGKMVFSSGVDPRVAAYHLVADKATGDNKWLYLDSKAPHTHDVRALAVLSGDGTEDAMLLSGGNDGQLLLYVVPRFLKEHPVRMSKSPQRPMMCLSRQERLLSVQQHQLDVWQLGQVASRELMRQASQQPAGEETEGDALELASAPCHLARITTSSSQHLVCAALSPDGSTVACSDATRVRVFKLTSAQHTDQQQQTQQQSEPSGLHVQRAPLSPSIPPAVCMAFAPDAGQLYSADGVGRIHCIQHEDGTVSASTSAAPTATAAAGARRGSSQAAAAGTAAHTCLPAVTHMAVSPNGQWLAAATGRGSVQLYHLPGLQTAGALLLVEEPAAAVAGMEFSPNSKTVAVATVANTLCVYDVVSRAPTQWTLHNHGAVRKLLDVLPACAVGLSFNPGGEDVVVYSACGMCHVDLSKPVSAAHLYTKRKRTAAPPPAGGAALAAASACGLNCRVMQLLDPCLFFGYLGSNAAVLVEKPWQEVLNALPPPLYRHRYGS